MDVDVDWEAVLDQAEILYRELKLEQEHLAKRNQQIEMGEREGPVTRRWFVDMEKKVLLAVALGASIAMENADEA